MRTRGLILYRAASSILAATVGFACLDGPAGASQDDLLRSLVEKNEAAWQRIQSLQSIQYTVEHEWLDTQSQQPFKGVGRVRKRGQFCWSTYRRMGHTGPLRVVAEKKMKAGDRSGPPMQLLEPDTRGEKLEQDDGPGHQNR